MSRRYDAVSRGMSRAFKRRARACSICGRKTVQKKNPRYWAGEGFVCRWADLHPNAAAQPPREEAGR